MTGDELLFAVKARAVDTALFPDFEENLKASRILAAVIRAPGTTMKAIIEARHWCSNAYDYAEILVENGYIEMQTPVSA